MFRLDVARLNVGAVGCVLGPKNCASGTLKSLNGCGVGMHSWEARDDPVGTAEFSRLNVNDPVEGCRSSTPRRLVLEARSSVATCAHRMLNLSKTAMDAALSASSS